MKEATTKSKRAAQDFTGRQDYERSRVNEFQARTVP